MYSLALYNNQNEIFIHYPSSNKDDPHVSGIPLTEQLSCVESLGFKLYPDNPGYNHIKELNTKIKSYDVRDNSIRFTGRVFKCEEKMDSDGKIYKNITCEGALSYLNDTKERGSSYTGKTGLEFITQILDKHNSKVEDARKIYPGVININKQVTHTCSFKTTLAEILETREEYKGQIRVREVNGKLYLDWMESFEDYTLDISLGVNMKEIIKSKDITELGTRIIPLGANNLTIESVNGGKDYIDNPTAIAEYGVIEKTVSYNDIEVAKDLLAKCNEDLNKHTQPSYVLSTNALDLSYLTGNKAGQFRLGVKLHIENKYMNIDDVYTINKTSVDLTTPYNPTLEITNDANSLTNTIQDIKHDTIQNNGVYNNVQIGSSFGIRAVRSDNKVITSLNATDGITIQKGNRRVFYVDTNGTLTVVDIVADGGEFVDIHAEGGEFSNITCTNGIVIQDGNVSCTINAQGIELLGQNGKKANIQILDDTSYSGTYIRDDCYIEDTLRVFGNAKFEKLLRGYGDFILEGNMEYKGVSLDEYIKDQIHDYSVDKGWE